jgi:hypothetical protein
MKEQVVIHTKDCDRREPCRFNQFWCVSRNYDGQWVMFSFVFFSRKALQSLAIEGDESYPVLTLQDNAVRYFHLAASIARKGSSLRSNVIGRCKITQSTPKLKLL